MLETIARTIILIGSFGISGALTMAFAASLGSDLFSSFLLGGIGVLFEVFKGLAWYQAGKRRVGFIVLGCLAGLFSFVSSLAFASMTLEQGLEPAESSSTSLETSRITMEGLHREESFLIETMAKLPPEWVTSNLRYATELKEVRSEEEKLGGKLALEQRIKSTSSLALSLAKRMGWNGGAVVAGLLGFMSLILEIGIAVLSMNRNLARFPLRQASDYEEVARFLRDSIGPNRKIVGRRDLVVQGWSERDIRRISRLLVDLGVLEYQGRGSGLQVSSKN